MADIIKRVKLEEMPYDKAFVVEGGNEQLCHSTGYEVLLADGDWWNEYVDLNGNLYYGR